MIKSIRHKEIRQVFESVTKSGIQANPAGRLRLQLAALDTAQNIDDMDLPGYKNLIGGAILYMDRHRPVRIGDFCNFVG